MSFSPMTASVTELRQNATRLLRTVNTTGEPVFILQNSKKTAVLLDEKTFEKLLETHKKISSGHDEIPLYFGKGKGLFGDGLKFQGKARSEWK